MNKVKSAWFTVHLERDRWSGPSVISVEEWDTLQQAKDSAHAVNSQNTADQVPETYWTAEVRENDFSLREHRKYVDKRKSNSVPVVPKSLKEQVTELSQILDQNENNVNMDFLRSKLIDLHTTVKNTPAIPSDVFDGVSEEVRRAALLGLIMVTVQAKAM